ncbi:MULTISPECIES: PAS domain-containing sensor histidine kinase [unclassified Nostoc]|uniref:PAS domain-containing sensor histidine kinase n=1 Tax=unclassified Nostoc TaxID=2593658 RepID=UPI000DECD746|nr:MULTISPECIES: PAS domain-containing sensor histidine kinase [unclassified Nostoc]QHG16745.1 PAS domain S-box protein [Nostoc sp. ATCC 53789]QLE49710.1 PAS domain S-box protein [Nostoc sp. C057]RCJ19429.1 PAS domain-containing sensor histidine kinase [Nostoc sp. ATCC 53789]
MNLDDLALQIELMRKRVALLQRQSEQQKAQEDIEFITDVFKELYLALEEMQIANEDLQQQNEELFNAQQSLIAQGQRYQELFEEVPDAYLVTDPRGVIQEANSAAQNMLNISKNFLLGKPLGIFVLEKELIAFHLKLTHLSDRAETPDWKMQEWEANMRPRNKTPIVAAMKVAAIRNQQGNLVGLRWLLRDISESKRIQAKLQWAEEAMRLALAKEREFSELTSRLLTTASHEFRNPLATIHSSAELLEHYRHLWSDERQQIHLRRIQTSVMHITQLLDDVLVLNQDETGKLEFNPTPLNLVEFCRDLLEELEQSDRSQHAIVFSSECQCTSANLDAKLLRQILSNLFSNCLKYSPIGSTVKFSVTTANERAIFQTQDSGIGIPPADIEHIFEPFHRASNTGNIPGMGLGMSIVKQAVDLHGGEIIVESAIDAGTTFTVILPFSRNLYV